MSVKHFELLLPVSYVPVHLLAPDILSLSSTTPSASFFCPFSVSFLTLSMPFRPSCLAFMLKDACPLAQRTIMQRP